MNYSVIYAGTRKHSAGNECITFAQESCGSMLSRKMYSRESPNRSLMHSIIRTVDSMKGGNHLRIFTSTPMAIGRFKSGLNVDISEKMIESIKRKGCSFEFFQVSCDNELWNYLKKKNDILLD